MKKNTLLFVGLAAVAAFFVIKELRRRREAGPRSTVEAGPTETITEAEYEAAPELVKPAAQAPQTILEVIKTLKKTPEQKTAALARKQARKAKRQTKKSQSAAVGEFSVLY